MKIQKAIGMLGHMLGLILQDAITSATKSIKDSEIAIVKFEEKLQELLKEMFLNSTEISDQIKNMLGITVLSEKKDKNDNSINMQLLDAICMLIAKSINRQYDTPEETTNSLINYGGEFFDIPLIEYINLFSADEFELSLDKRFGSLNDFLVVYGVYIHALKYTKDLNKANEPIRIHIRIFL